MTIEQRLAALEGLFNNQTPQRFPGGMTKASQVSPLDSIMIGMNADGTSKVATINQIANLISAVGGASFKGNIIPTSSPVISQTPVFYVATKGVYPNFGGKEVTGAAAIIGQNGNQFTVTNLDIPLDEYSKVKNIYTMGAINGEIVIDIDPAGTVTAPAGGTAWVQYGAEYLSIASPMNVVRSGLSSAGLNWIYYSRSTKLIRVYNYTSPELPNNSEDAVLIGFMYNADVNRLTTLSEKNIRVAGYFKNRVCGSLTFKGRCVIDKVKHKIILSDSYYQSTGGGYVDVVANDYFDASSDPTPFTFEYDPGLLLQSIVFDPERLNRGLNPFVFHGIGYIINNPKQILIATIVLNNVTTDFNFDEISPSTVESIKGFYGQQIMSILGDGTIDIKTNGDVEVSGIVYALNNDGIHGGISQGITPLKSGSRTSGINWLVVNTENGKIYLVNYGTGINRETENVIGYMYNIDVNSLKTFSKISVNGVFPGEKSSYKTTGELLLPKKIFLEASRMLPVYKRSIMKNRTENNNELVVIKNSSSDTDFNVSRKYVYGDYELSPFAVNNNEFLGFASINNQNGDRDYINNVQIIKKAATSKTIKGQQIGDSLTNRGVSKYVASYLANSFSSALITYNTYGTLDNSGKQGEGREGWTYSNFIGKDNFHHFGGGVIQRGNGGMNQNPFLKLADAVDKSTKSNWCFRNTGSQLEQSYASDPDKTGDFYIFDYAWYIAQNAIPNDIQVITIALSTNDYSLYGGDALNSCVLGLNVMLSQIKTALPNVKIGVIPTPVYGSSESGVSRFEQAAEWINKAMEICTPIANVDVVGVWAHMSSVFDFPYNDLGFTSVGNGTKILMKSDVIHFDIQGYLQYAPVVANWIINVT